MFLPVFHELVRSEATSGFEFLLTTSLNLSLKTSIILRPLEGPPEHLHWDPLRNPEAGHASDYSLFENIHQRIIKGDHSILYPGLHHRFYLVEFLYIRFLIAWFTTIISRSRDSSFAVPSLRAIFGI